MLPSTPPFFFFCNLCGTLTKGRGLPQYTQLYVTSRSIKMLPLFPLYLCLSLSPSPSISLSLSSTSAQQPIHLMQFPSSLLSRHPRRLPSSLFPSLTLSLAAQVMSFFFSWILLPSPISLPPSLALTLSSVSH